MPLSWSCTDHALLEALKKRDPSGQGLPSVQALRLLMSLLHWNPAARPTAEQASFATPNCVERWILVGPNLLVIHKKCYLFRPEKKCPSFALSGIWTSQHSHIPLFVLTKPRTLLQTCVLLCKLILPVCQILQSYCAWRGLLCRLSGMRISRCQSHNKERECQHAVIIDHSLVGADEAAC